MIKRYLDRAAARQEARALQQQVRNASLLPEYLAYEHAVTAYAQVQRQDINALSRGPEGENHGRLPVDSSGEEVRKAAANLHARLTREGVADEMMQGVMQGLNDRAERAAGKAAGKRGL